MPNERRRGKVEEDRFLSSAGGRVHGGASPEAKMPLKRATELCKSGTEQQRI